MEVIVKIPLHPSVNYVLYCLTANRLNNLVSNFVVVIVTIAVVVDNEQTCNYLVMVNIVLTLLPNHLDVDEN